MRACIQKGIPTRRMEATSTSEPPFPRWRSLLATALKGHCLLKGVNR